MTDFLEKMYNVFKPILPKKFDENEWLTIIVAMLVFSIFYYLHKKKTVLFHTEVIAILLLNLLYTTVGDYFLAMPPYDFYDTVDHNSGEIMDIILQNIVYPVTLLIFMHYYAKYRPNNIGYIIFGALFLYGLEWISVEYFHLYTYKTWKSWYSLLFYFPVIVLNIIFYNKFHKYVESQRKVSGI